MQTISKSEALKLDKEVDALIPVELLAGIERDKAIMHILRVHEDFTRLLAQDLKGQSGLREGWKSGQDGIHYAIHWIYKFCKPETSSIHSLRFNSDLYKRFADILIDAMSYSKVWDLMSMMHRDQVIGEREGQTVTFKYQDSAISIYEVADQILSNPDEPDWINKSARLAKTFDLMGLLKESNPRCIKNKDIIYTWPATSFLSIRQQLTFSMRHLWHFDPSWDVGGYTFADFKTFWLTLVSYSQIHCAICTSSGRTGGGIEYLVMIKKKEEWIEFMAKHSSLSEHKCSLILADLIYDEELQGAGKKSPDVTYQPFFVVAKNHLALSNQLVIMSNAERNLWDLMEIKRKQIHSKLRNKKESLWIEKLQVDCSEYGLLLKGPIKYSFEGATYDIDLILLDISNKFLIALQLKWLTDTDRINQIAAANVELNRGLKQCEVSLQWIESDRNLLAEKLEIDSDLLKDCSIKAAILSKNFMGKGKITHPEIPIFNERLLHWILGMPCKRNLPELWHAISKKTYLPKVGKHFQEADIKAQFADISFIGENLGMLSLNEWNPAKDITFESESI